MLIVGYQGQGTLGRKLVDGAQSVNIFGEKIAVQAHIYTINGLSAHAGQTDLLKWFAAVAGSRPQVVLTHGEPRGSKPLARLIEEKHGLTPVLPYLGQEFEL